MVMCMFCELFKKIIYFRTGTLRGGGNNYLINRKNASIDTVYLVLSEPVSPAAHQPGNWTAGLPEIHGCQEVHVEHARHLYSGRTLVTLMTCRKWDVPRMPGEQIRACLQGGRAMIRKFSRYALHLELCPYIRSQRADGRVLDVT